MWFIKEKIVKDEKREKELSDELITAENRNINILARMSVLKDQLKTTTDSAVEIRKERDKLKKMVRDQTEADLLINALKSLGVIPTKGKSQQEFFDDNRRLQELQRRSQEIDTQLTWLRGPSPFGIL